MSNYLKEAFKALDLLDSENDLILEGRSFSLDNTGIEDFMNYMNLDDIAVADIDVVDPQAETEEDLKATYVGDTILECVACHNLSYCNPTEVVIDEEAGVANMFVECPVCLSNEGYKIVGTVAPYEDVDVSTTGEAEDVKVEIDGSSAADIEVTETKVEEGKEGTNSVDVGKTLRKSFGGRFTESCNNKVKGRRYHISRNDNEEALEASQKHPVDVTKSEAGKLKESSESEKAKAFFANKKRHLGTKDKEEAIEDSQKFPVEGTKQEDPKARYKKHLGTNKKGEDIEACQKNPVDVTKSEAGRLSEDRKERLEKAKAKRQHISKNDNEEALEVSQKHPVDVTKTKAGKLSESKKEQIKARLKKRHAGNNENEENLEDSQRYPVESPQAAQTGLKEAMEDISITTDGEVIKIKSTPRADKEMIVPPQEEPKKQEIEEETPAVSEEGETAEIEVDEIDEEAFDTLGESFLKKTYRNVDSFKTSSAKKADNALVLEGIITFKSGKKAKTRFMFEAATVTRKGNVRFVGLNEHIAKKKGSFKLDASIKDGKLVCESLNYNYTGKDARTGKSQRLYGTLRNK